MTTLIEAPTRSGSRVIAALAGGGTRLLAHADHAGTGVAGVG